MQRREVLKTLGCAAGMLFVPSLASDVLARSGRKYHPERWRGFNLLNYFNPDHTEPFNEEEFKWISDWGFNFVRLPLSYWAWSRPGEYYQMDARVLDDLDRAVEFGRKHHIHVCLNLHRAPGYCINPPLEKHNLFHDREALDGCAYQWSVLAKRYKGVSSRHLSFNLLNEVSKATAEEYERVVRRLVGEIRHYSPRRLILIDGLDVGSRPLLSVPDLKGIIQCGRGYHPMLVSHYAASWVYGNGEMYFPKEKLSWPLDADGQHYDRQALLEMQRRNWTPLLEQGGQVFIGEFGCHNQTPHKVALDWLRDNLSVFREMQWGWSIWNLRGSFGPMDSHRSDVDYKDFHGHKLDEQMLRILQTG